MRRAVDASQALSWPAIGSTPPGGHWRFLRKAQRARADGKTQAGLQAMADFIEANVPEAERARAGEVLIRILNGVLFELAQMSARGAGFAACPADATSQAFMTRRCWRSAMPLYPRR
jgi:cytochrome c biogenesis protein